MKPKIDKIKIILLIVALLIAITVFIICNIDLEFSIKEINELIIKLKEESNTVYQCYSDKNINNYGKLYKVCNSCKFNNTKYIDIKNINIKCNKDCPTYDCIKYTKIKVFNNTDVIDFFECFENINKDYFQIECKGIQNCDKKKYNDINHSIRLYIISIVCNSIILLMILFLTVVFILNIHHIVNNIDLYEHL